METFCTEYGPSSRHDPHSVSTTRQILFGSDLMRKAGGIIALIAGVLGVGAAIVTLGIGGIGSALDAEDAGTVVGLGWGGVACSFLSIVLGAVAIGTKGRIVGVLLIACAIAGVIGGGTLVAVFMALTAIGGILATIDSGRAPAASPQGN